jgi:hypothetical protein
MSFKQLLIVISLCLLALSAGSASAGEKGAIKRFLSFPVDTYELGGRLSDIVLEQATTPPTGEIAVDGYWPDRKLLLISFAGEAYHVLYRDVEMQDQAAWDARMAASGGLRCSGGTASPRTGGNTGSRVSGTAATKGFINPC